MIKKRKAINNRHEEIISLIKNKGFVTVEEMATLFNVTPKPSEGILIFLTVKDMSQDTMEVQANLSARKM